MGIPMQGNLQSRPLRLKNRLLRNFWLNCWTPHRLLLLLMRTTLQADQPPNTSTAFWTKKGLKRAAVIKAAGLNETFGYQIFKGERQGSRNKMLQLAFAMGLSLQETNRLLQAARVNELYPKDRRDAIIIFCLDKGYSLTEVECELYRFGEATIC